MRLNRKSIPLAVLILVTSLAVGYAANSKQDGTDNSYYLYTAAFKPTDAGIVAVPSRFKWSVETSWRGIDDQGRNLPDTRVMLRLYDPDHNSTALTAQMNLETAEKLQRELADIVAKKRENPYFQHRRQLYDSKSIPTGLLKGVNEDGQAIIEIHSKETK